jgi:hypothetical protein
MYRAMGIDHSCCVAYSLGSSPFLLSHLISPLLSSFLSLVISSPSHFSEAFVNSTLEIAQNQTLNRFLREQILKYNSRLYGNRSVISEWEEMLRYVHLTPRPVPFRSSPSSSSPLPPQGLLWEDQRVHPDIIRDLRTINQTLSKGQRITDTDTETTGVATVEEQGAEDRRDIRLSLALSIPFNEPPLRLRDVLR